MNSKTAKQIKDWPIIFNDGDHAVRSNEKEGSGLKLDVTRRSGLTKAQFKKQYPVSNTTGRVVSNDGNTLVIRYDNGTTRKVGRLDKHGDVLALGYNNRPLTPEEFQSWFPVGLDRISL